MRRRLVEDWENFEISAYELTAHCSASELPILMCLWEDSNFQLHAYQACALTIELHKHMARYQLSITLGPRCASYWVCGEQNSRNSYPIGTTRLAGGDDDLVALLSNFGSF